LRYIFSGFEGRREVKYALDAFVFRHTTENMGRRA